jgi:phage tail sheath protein FI
MNYGTSSLLLQVSSYTLDASTPAGSDEAKEFNGFVSQAIQGTINAQNYLKVATKTLTLGDATAVKTLVTTIQTNIIGGMGSGLLAPFDGLIADLTLVNTTEMTAVDTAADSFADTDGQTLALANALKITLSNLLDALNGVMDGMTTAYNDPTTDFVGGNINYLQNSRPSIYSEVISGLNGFRVTLNPSGAMAGIYARVDNSKGVWQAPANVGVQNVIGPAVLVTNEQQGSFNIDSLSGKSINVIRNFTGRGTTVWGARTLDGNSNELRYVNVRRLFIYLEESIKRASQFVVFEPNDANMWVRTKGMISNFLTDVWRSGGLVGATAEEAFFVNIGVGTSMTTMDVLEGRMIIEIGVAAVRPAEFIILRFTHFVQE